MTSQIVLDFGRVEEPERPRPARPSTDKLARSREGFTQEQLDRVLPDVNVAAPGRGVSLPAELIEAAKATFISSGGNIAEVARVHDLATPTVTRLAATKNWPVYGDGMTSGEKGRKSRLIHLANTLENRLFQLAEAMGVETKDVGEITEKGLGSKYVAPLTQRSSAFAAVFDRYMRVMALLEPELFASDDDPSNPVAAKIRARQNRDALGGVDGVDRRLAEFAARVAVTAVQEVEDRKAISAGDIIDVEVEE